MATFYAAVTVTCTVAPVGQHCDGKLGDVAL